MMRIFAVSKSSPACDLPTYAAPSSPLRRMLAKGQRVAEALRSAAACDARIDLVEADLEDLESVRRGAQEIAHAAAGRRVRLLVENAGIWPRSYATTLQGHEIAFGVDVLAHFVLRRELAAAGVLAGTRVVTLTGDIYILAARDLLGPRYECPVICMATHAPECLHGQDCGPRSVGGRAG